MQIYLGQDLPATPRPVELRLSWVISIDNSSLLEGEEQLFFIVLEEKEAEVVELILHSFTRTFGSLLPGREHLSSGLRSSCFSGKCIVTEEHAISVLPDLRENHIYFLWTYHHDEKNEYWIYQQGIGIVPSVNTTAAINIKQVRGDCIWSRGIWMLCSYP
jgi:hypothetical protein